MVALSNTYSPYSSATVNQTYYPRPAAGYQMASTASETPAMPTDQYTRISSMVATGAGGAFASFKYSEEMAESIHNYSQLGELQGVKEVMFMSFKEMGGIAFKGAGVSALVSAGVSVVANGVSLAKGNIDKNTAARNVVGDTITGAVGGLGAVTLGGLGGLALVKLGATGLPITIATVAIGAATGVGASMLREKIMKQ